MENPTKLNRTNNKIKPTGKDAELDLSWRLGIFVKKNKPLKVKRFKDLTEKDLNRSFGIFVSWMRIIGIDPNIPKTKDWRWLVWFIQRWTCLFLSVGVNIFATFSFYQKVNSDSKKNNSTIALATFC